MGALKKQNGTLLGTQFGNYAVRSLIGRGSMGVVYLAKDTVLGRYVALKVMEGNTTRNPEMVRRFQLEAQAAAPLEHPNIVSIYEAGMRDGIPFVAMEYIEGEPLDQFLRRTGPRLQWQHALHICEQVAKALECAHKAGIIHRDVKPANILIDRRGRVRLTDFGIANAGHLRGISASRAEFVGTPEYMSPEQCEGSFDLTPGSDLFSLGVMVYQMLTGQMPFEGDSPLALIKSITTQEPQRVNRIVPTIPDDVARLVALLLEKDPENRTDSAPVLIQTIQRLQKENGGASAMPEALRAFLKEELRPRELGGDTPHEKRRRFRAPKITVTEGRKHLSPISFLAKGAVCLMVAIALLGVGYWRVVRPESPGPAPEIAGMRFVEETTGILSVPLPATEWRARAVHWAGKDPVALISVSGRNGGASSGVHGLLALAPEETRAVSVRPPSGALLDAEYWRTTATGEDFGAVPETPADAPLHGAVLLRGALDMPGGKTAALAQRWDRNRPEPKLLADFDAGQWRGGTAFPWEGTGACPAAIKPDGKTICFALTDPQSGGVYLAERDVEGFSGMGAALTPPGASLVSGTLVYAPNGASLAYMREEANGKRTLYTVGVGGDAHGERALRSGALDDCVAFDASGENIAVSEFSNEAWRVTILRANDGAVVAEPGLGRISGECWHPSGQYLVASAPDPNTGREQLWSIETRAPYARRVLTRMENGGIHGAAVSRDGRWLAAVAESDGGAAVIFVDLTTALLSV